MRKKLLNRLSPRTVFNLEVCLKGAMKDGEPDTFVDSPIRKLKAMSKEELSGITGELTDALVTKEKLKWYEPEEQQKLIVTAKAYSEGVRSLNYSIPREKDLRPYIRIYLGLHTGMRSGEISALTWNKINLEEGTISISHNVEYSKGDTVGKIKLPKTKTSIRTIDLTKADVQELSSYKLWVQEKLLPMRVDINNIAVIFYDTFGLLHRSQTRKIYDTIVKQSGLKHRGFHALRHTHASNLIDAEIYPLAISRRLGHSTIAITMDIYSHFFNRKKKKMVSMLEIIQGGQKVENFK